MRVSPRSGNGHEYVSVVDPDTGDVLESGGFIPGDVLSPEEPASLRARSHDGHATLVYTGAGGEKTLIDAEGPRNYSFWEYGMTATATTPGSVTARIASWWSPSTAAAAPGSSPAVSASRCGSEANASSRRHEAAQPERLIPPGGRKRINIA